MSKHSPCDPIDSTLSQQPVEKSQAPDWSEDKSHRLFQTINTGFALCQVIRDQTEKMVDCQFLELNPSFEKLIGINPQEAVGKVARDVFPSLEQGWLDVYQQVIDSGQTIRFERFIPGLNRWFELTAFFLWE